jgi:predicted membrane protein
MTDQQTSTAPRPLLLYGGVARAVSLMLALAICLVILALPQLVVSADGSVDHSWLTVLMWGMAAGFVHGVGFVPHNKLLRIALGPLVAWGASVLAIVAFVQL